MSLRALPQVFAGEGGKSRSLFLIDSGFGGHEVPPGTGLYLDKAKRVLVPGNQIDITAATRRTIVAGHDNESKLA